MYQRFLLALRQNSRGWKKRRYCLFQEARNERTAQPSLHRQTVHLVKSWKPGANIAPKVTRARLRAPDRQPWPCNDQGENKWKHALWNQKEEAIKLLRLKWGRGEVVCVQWREVQKAFHLSAVIWIWLSYLQVNILRVFWAPKIWPSVMGTAVTTEGREADKNEEEKERETRGLDGFFFFPSQKTLFPVCTIQKGHNDTQITC